MTDARNVLAGAVCAVALGVVGHVLLDALAADGGVDEADGHAHAQLAQPLPEIPFLFVVVCCSLLLFVVVVIVCCWSCLLLWLLL